MKKDSWQKAVALAATITPELEKLEKKRRGHLLFLIIGLPAAGIIGIIELLIPANYGYSQFCCFRGSSHITDDPFAFWILGSLLLMVFLGAAIGGAIGCYKLFDYDYRRKAKRVLVYKIAQAMRMRYQPTGLFRVGRVYDHYIFPAYNIDKIEDGFLLQLGRRNIELQEITLHRTYGEGIGWPPRLLPANERGIVIRIETRKTHPFHTVIIPRKFLRGQYHKSYFMGMHHYERTPFGNPSFARRYDVLSEDHTDAHDIFGHDFIEKFLRFEKLSGAKSLSASIKKREIVIYARNAHNLFEPGHLLSPVNVRSIKNIYDELQALNELIETLTLNPHVGI